MTKVQDVRAELVTENISVINELIDKLITENKKPKFNLYKHFVSQQLDKKTILQIKNYEHFIQDKREAESAYDGSDEFLVEAYSTFSRPKLRIYIEYLEEIIDDINKYHAEKVAARKTRRRKIDPAKLVKNLKYREVVDIATDRYISFNPVDIINSKQLVVYNTKTREIAVYYGESLSVRNSSIINYDKNRSWSKTLRKPAEVLDSIISSTREFTNNLRKELTTKEKLPSGRISEYHILLKCF